MNSIDIKKVVKRIKRELNIKYDAELARILGIDRTYLGTLKSRGEFTGTVWNKLLILCHEKDIDINYVVFGKSTKDDVGGHLVANIIRQIVSGTKDADHFVDQVREAQNRYAEELPKDVYQKELLRLAQKLIEVAL